MLTYLEGDDLPLSARLDGAIEAFASFLDAPRVEARRTLVLEDGARVERADVVHALGGADGAMRLQAAERGLRTFLMVMAAPAAELERRERTADAVLGSFVSFPPAPYGIARNRALTMPWGDPFTLDPAVSRESLSHLYIEHLFSGLVRLDDRLSVRPDLAERIDLDETGTVYTFTLRDGIAFHDGRAITAEDVKYSIERAADPALMSDTAPLYLGDIVGVREKLAGRAAEVRGVEVADSRTVRITIDAPKAVFLAKLAYPTAAVVDRLTVEPGGFEWWRGGVNGSGPFALERWEEGEVLVLARSDAYHTPSSLEFAVFPILRGLTMQLYESDAVDVALIAGTNVDRALDPVNGLDDQLVVYPQFHTRYVGFNAREAPFDDPHVRLAFAMALDRDALIETVLGGKVDPASGLLPPGLPGYSEALVGIPYDPEAARALLAASRYADGLPPRRLHDRRHRGRSGRRAVHGRCVERGVWTSTWRSNWSNRAPTSTSSTSGWRGSSPTAGWPTIPIPRTSWTCCCTAPTPRTTSAATTTPRSTPCSNAPGPSGTSRPAWPSMPRPRNC